MDVNTNFSQYPMYLVEAALSNGSILGCWLSSFGTPSSEAYPNYQGQDPSGNTVIGLAYYDSAMALTTAVLDGIKSAFENFDWSQWGWTITSVAVTAVKYSEQSAPITLS